MPPSGCPSKRTCLHDSLTGRIASVLCSKKNEQPVHGAQRSRPRKKQAQTSDRRPNIVSLKPAESPASPPSDDNPSRVSSADFHDVGMKMLGAPGGGGSTGQEASRAASPRATSTVPMVGAPAAPGPLSTLLRPLRHSGPNWGCARVACIVAFTLGTCLSIFNVAYVQVGGVHAVRGGTCTQPAEQVARPQSDTHASLRHSAYTFVTGGVGDAEGRRRELRREGGPRRPRPDGTPGAPCLPTRPFTKAAAGNVIPHHD